MYFHTFVEISHTVSDHIWGVQVEGLGLHPSLIIVQTQNEDILFCSILKKQHRVMYFGMEAENQV